MNVPLEIVHRGFEATDAIDNSVRKHCAKLEEVCDHINSCRVALEKPHEHPSSGGDYRVRIDLRVAPGHEIAINHEPKDGHVHQDLYQAMHSAFDAARKALRRFTERQQKETRRQEPPLKIQESLLGRNRE